MDNNETTQPIITQSMPPQQSSIPTSSKSKLKPLLLSLLAIAVLIAVAYGVYTWQHKKVSAANIKVSSLQSQLTSLNKQVAKLQNILSKTSPETTNSTVQPSKPTNATQSTSYLTISQWGVRAPYNGSLTLKYVVDQYDANNIALSSAQMEAAGSPNNDGANVCAYTDNGEAGHLTRYLPTDTIDSMGVPANTTAQQYIQQNPNIPHATVGQYTYIYWSYLKNGTYNGPCATTVTEQTMNAYAALISQLASY